MYDNHSLSSSGVMDAAPPLVVEPTAADCGCGALDAWTPSDSVSSAARDAPIGREIMNPNPPCQSITPEDLEALTSSLPPEGGSHETCRREARRHFSNHVASAFRRK